MAVETHQSHQDLLWLLEHEPDLFATTLAYLEWRDQQQRK